MNKLTFKIDGRAAPKGSLKPIRNRKTGSIMLVPQNSKTLSVWRAACKASLSNSPASFHDKAVRVSVTYYFKRTGPQSKSHNDPAPMRRTHGDLDKLNRCIFDELTQADIISDDSCITSECSAKRWSDTGDNYVIISVEEDDCV